jgi:hypothetical protein
LKTYSTIVADFCEDDMLNYQRADVEGDIYFFTVKTFRWLSVLTEEPVRAALRETIRQKWIRHVLPTYLSQIV